MDLLPLISIPIIYFLFAFTKPYFQPKLPFNFCAICASVSISWLIMLVLWLTGTSISVLPIGILLGMSITGAMYKGEKLFKAKHIRNFWFVRLVIIVGGFYGVYLLLQKDWNPLFLVAIVGFFAVVIPSLLFQGTTHKDVIKEQKKAGLKASIIKRLDDCC